MLLPLAIVTCFALSACGKKRPDRPMTTRLLAHWTSWDQDAALEVAGVRGDSMAVDVPQAEVKDGIDVNVVYETPCGPKKLTFPLPTAQSVPADEYQIQDFDFSYKFDIPEKLDPPSKTTLLFDPKLNGEVVVGTMVLSVQNGVPAGMKEYSPTKGLLLRDVECIDKITVAGTETQLPAKPDRIGDKVLFVTARDGQCFVDERVGYGNQMSHATTLNGSRAYWIDAVPTYWFRPAESSISASSKAQGLSLHALNECATQ
ncbi:MAG: hypothetical protein HOW73_42835 [Polyangiaceae bacterium]|nr:hypothetical protein [Polyangiaceae bacterium]